jgi:hypothetical protein
MIGWAGWMKALPLLKHNIDTLLRERRHTRRDLAMWVRQSMDKKKIDPWISHIFSKPDAEFQMKYLDRIAEFFGVPVYQLFQPGISHLTERRKAERRTGKDRRVSAMNQRVRQSLSEAVASLSQTDVADMIRLKTLSDASRDAMRIAMQAAERSEQQAVRRAQKRHGAGTGAVASTKRGTTGKIREVEKNDGTEG